VDEFHRLYYDGVEKTWKDTRWMGATVWKCPLDLWIYQEIIWEQRPDLVVECGTAHGGSALFMANILDLVGRGRVVTIDITDYGARPVHPRIEYILGSSVDAKTLQTVKSKIPPKGRVMVVLDSDHSKAHVLAEMDAYGPLVTPGGYMVVEDGNVNGHPVYPSHGPGPAEAIAEWIPRHTEFVQDRSREKLMLTFNPGGYLRRAP